MYPFQYNNDNTIVSSRLQQLFGDYDVRVTRSNFLFVLNFATNWNSQFSSIFDLTGQCTKLIGNMFSMFNPMSAMTSKCNFNDNVIFLDAYFVKVTFCRGMNTDQLFEQQCYNSFLEMNSFLYVLHLVYEFTMKQYYSITTKLYELN